MPWWRRSKRSATFSPWTGRLPRNGDVRHFHVHGHVRMFGTALWMAVVGEINAQLGERDSVSFRMVLISSSVGVASV